jgi:hypothetical protein
MKHRTLSPLAAVVLLASALLSPAAAQQPPPDVRGTYTVGGAAIVSDCTFEGGEYTVAVVGVTLVVDSQDGDAISGVVESPGQQVLTFSGHVSSSGQAEGTWVFVNDPSGGQYHDEVFAGEFTADGKVAIDFDATVGNEFANCHYRLSLASESATLSWNPPDPNTEATLPPPRALTIVPNADAAAPGAEKARDAQVTGYNVYRSGTPNVQTTPENLFASVPATQTSLPTSVDPSGSFFVVTAIYDAGESGPSNEVSGGVSAATLASVKVSAAKIVAKGSDFSATVQVFVDGLPFASAAKVKGGKKVTQKGNLLTGQSLGQYLSAHDMVAVTFRNENGGVATYVYTRH